MKMTMHIDEQVLADVMDLTGAKTKTDAVEMALRDLARRHRQRRLFRTPIYDSADQWAADVAPKPSDAIDAPVIDDAAVQRFLTATAARRQQREAGFTLNEGPSPLQPSAPSPEGMP